MPISGGQRRKRGTVRRRRRQAREMPPVGRKTPQMQRWSPFGKPCNVIYRLEALGRRLSAAPFGNDGVAEKRAAIREKTCEQDRRRETIPAGIGDCEGNRHGGIEEKVEGYIKKSTPVRQAGRARHGSVQAVSGTVEENKKKARDEMPECDSTGTSNPDRESDDRNLIRAKTGAGDARPQASSAGPVMRRRAPSNMMRSHNSFGSAAIVKETASHIIRWQASKRFIEEGEGHEASVRGARPKPHRMGGRLQPGHWRRRHALR